MTGFTDEDLQVRRALLALAEHGDVDVDVDAGWDRLVSSVRAADRRARVRRVLAVAAVVVLLLTAGRPVVESGATALARFLVDAATSTVDGVADRIVDAVPTRDAAHGPIDESNEFWVEVRGVHDQLNDAVGWKRWRPRALEGAADRLEAVASQDPAYEGQAREAAELIRRAVAENDRGSATEAHAIVARIEIGLAARSASATTTIPG